MNTNNLDELKNHAEMLKKTLAELNQEDFDYDLLGEYGEGLKELEKDLKNYKPTLELGYVLMSPDTYPPKYNYDSDSGFDLHSIEEITIPPLSRAIIPTGLILDIKDGYEIQVRTKSGLAINQGLMVLNSPGTVDSGYLGEIKVILFNTNQHPVTITKGMKVAQAVLCPVVNGGWINLKKKSKIAEKDRNANGFGSTGI